MRAQSAELSRSPPQIEMRAQSVPASPQPGPKDLPALDKLLRNTAVAAW